MTRSTVQLYTEQDSALPLNSPWLFHDFPAQRVRDNKQSASDPRGVLTDLKRDVGPGSLYWCYNPLEEPRSVRIVKVKC